MPQALTIDPTLLAGSIKRQRSADSRDADTNRNAAGQEWATQGQLKPNMRVPAYLEKTKSEISSTFQDLEWKQRFRMFHAMQNPQVSPFRIDRSNIVIARNRYANVQPWDQSRIKLNIPIGGSDYVNASPIVLKRATGLSSSLSVAVDDGKDFSESKYIATQGPKADQLSHFWYMVHQETVGDEGAIVMLTQCYEAGKEKCAVYFPTSLENPVLELHHDDSDSASEATSGSDDENSTDQKASTHSCLGTVTLVSSTHDASIGCDVRIFDVAIAESTKRIHHFLFNGWPDFGKPEAEDRVALLNLTRKSFAVANGSPRIVHCSAGVGRTGTFIALDFLVREIEEGRFIDNKIYPYLKSPTYQTHPDHANSQQTPTTDTWGKSGPPKVQTPTMETTFSEDPDQQSFRDDLIYSTVNTLREQRMMMVINELQYALLYEIVREVFWEKYSTPPEGAIVKPASGTTSTDDVRKAKAPKVEDEGGASDAETEIIDAQDHDLNDAADIDPYHMVAPEHIREVLEKQE